MSTDTADNLEEELRLAYVAMTRARDHLYVTWPLRFYTHPQGHSDSHVYSQRSRFFTPEVLGTMERVTFGEEIPADSSDPFFAPTDIRDKMKQMWE